MTAPFGVNILAQYVHDRAALLNWLTAAQPAATVVMDDHALTQQIRKALPNSLTIARAYNPNDARYWEVVSPQEWVNAHVPFAANGVYVQCLNEPVLNDAALTWLEQVGALCPPSMRLALPNFAVGNPYENDILNGKYDRLLRLVCGTRHILATHEYFQEDPEAELPWLCGRFVYWQRRARVLGWQAPTICITEHGRDIGGGRNDGWRGAGWTEEAYFARLAEAQASVYDNAMPVCIFCWGNGAADHWLSFDIQDAPTLQKLLIDWNTKHPISEVTPPVPIPPPTGNPTPMRVTAPAGLKLRATPNGAVLRIMPYGEAVTGYPATAQVVAGFTWLQLVDALGTTGWAADTYLTPVVQPPVGFRLKYPFKRSYITDHFNSPRNYSTIAPGKLQKHEGIDLVDLNAQQIGTDPIIHVGAPCKVIEVGYQASGYGNFIRVEFGGGWYAYYGHMAEVYVKQGQTLKDLQIVGLMGATGFADGAHCHLTLQSVPGGLDGYVVSDVIDPEPLLVAW